LLWSDCNSYALREEGDGSLWIGTSGGLAHLINPASVLAPPAYKLTLANASLAGTPFGEAAALRWQQGLLVFTLGALNFLHGPPPQIRYRLLGLEEDWHRSEDGVLLYGSIAPGDYRLQAVAEDATGAAASPMLDLPFRILPLWWQSAPLRWTAAILAILCAFLFWNSWMNWRRINQKNLEELVQQRTQTLEQERAELQRMRERMHHMAEYDDLTGLWTRRIILERLRSELDRARRHALPISILLIDLDRFRKINEDAGQQNGDRILQELSRILLRAVRSYDLVGRYNGGMFIVILPGSNAAAACARAEELRQAFAAARLPAGIGNVAVTASFGVASSSQGAQNALLDAAARALRRAKSHGRNCVMLEEVQEHKGVAERSGALSEKA
jgi:diguanylate cyclase (GGDEF)-like protein